MESNVASFTVSVEYFTYGHEQTHTSIVTLTLQTVHQMINGIKLNKIMNRVGPDDKLIGRIQFHSSPEIGDAKRDSVAIVNITWVTQKADPGISFVLYCCCYLLHHQCKFLPLLMVDLS
uniref:Uncharacterized protein n=1 Tax=Opuntia streptacantha TaxID=393608 RepID=A0A7C9ADU6_OPUST